VGKDAEVRERKLKVGEEVKLIYAK